MSLSPESLERIVGLIHERGLSLPTLPDVALKVRDIARDPDSNVNDLAAVISQDASITAHLIQVANSPLYRGAMRIESIPAIINRLGMRTVSNLVVSLAMRQMFRAESKVVEQMLRESWEFSTRVAAHASLIAREVRGLDADQAMLSGLIHAIGALPVISIAPQVPELARDAAVLGDAMLQLQPRFGLQIVRAWEFPAHFEAVVQEANNHQRRHEGKADYADAVICAVLKVRFEDDPERLAALWAETPAAEKLGLSLATGDLDEEMNELMASLKG